MLITSFVVAALIEVLLPIALGYYFWKKLGATWRVFFIGVAAFLVSQIIHVPLLMLRSYLYGANGAALSALPAMAQYALDAVLVGLLAAVCEEPARYFAFKILKARGNSSRSALMLGAGHGGLESILVGVSVIGSTISLIMFQTNPNSFANIGMEQLSSLMQLVQTPWYMPLLGAFERVAAVVLHLSLSLLVWRSIHSRKIGFLFLAMLVHTLVNALTVFLSYLGWSALAVEGVMAVVLVLSLVYIYFTMWGYGRDTLYDDSKLPEEEPEFEDEEALEGDELAVGEMADDELAAGELAEVSEYAGDEDAGEVLDEVAAEDPEA